MVPDPADILPILTEGDPRLAAVAAPVRFPDEALPGVLQRLHATLADFRKRAGFGRAMGAPQVVLSTSQCPVAPHSVTM